MAAGGPLGADFPLRLASSVVLMAVALGALWWGGVVFAGFVAFGCALVMAEWNAMAGPYPSRAAGPGAVLLVAVAAVAASWDPAGALASLAAVAVVAALFGVVDHRMRWLAAGILYAGLPGVAAVVLRGGGVPGDLSTGLAAILFVFAAVWGTDSGAYVAGRTIGGPKVWPRVSPKKTWSGALGGLATAVAVGLVFAHWRGVPALPIAVLAVALSVVSQVGDFAESAMKRRYGVKDSGRIIPGHGGVMDRVDGLVVALVLAAVVGATRDPGDVAAGLIAW